MAENNGKLDVLIDQVGHLTEGLTEFRADMAEIKGLVREQLAVSQSQAESIRRIAETTEKQNAVSERLAVSVERLAATVERQSQMVETLMGRQ